MPHLAVDRRSFVLDGRRLWLISGSIHYARLTPALWARRLQQAQADGLNCIDVPVPWSFHQPGPDTFDFTGSRNLRAFLEQVAEAGLRAIVRPGPYLGMGYDRGGLPAWLAGDPGRTSPVRDAGPSFLAACSRYLTAVMDQIRPLQATAPRGGPVVLMQIDNLWLSHQSDLAADYLRQLVRYLREAGCQVPLCNNNRFLQPVEGTFTAWSGEEHLAADLRQVTTLQPEAPLLLIDLNAEPDPASARHRLADAFSTGAQVNLSHWDALPAETRQTLRPLTLFASQFASVLADQEPVHHATLNGPLPGGILQLSHQFGRSGQVVWLRRWGSELPATEVPLLLPGGLTLPVPLAAEEQVAWVLLETRLGGIGILNYTNLRPLALLKEQVLVLFGPSGSTGHLSLDGATLQVPVPKSADDAPHVEQVDELTLIVLSEAQAAIAFLARTADGLQLALDSEGSSRIITSGGFLQTGMPVARRPRRAPRLGVWQQADPVADTSATSSDVAAAAPPGGEIGLQIFEWLSPPEKISSSGSTRWLSLNGACIHLFQEDLLAATLGATPTAVKLQTTASRSAGPLRAVVINPPQPDEGAEGVLWPRHLPGPIYPVKALRLEGPAQNRIPMPNWRELPGYRPSPPGPGGSSTEQWRWSLPASKDHPLILELGPSWAHVLLEIDEQPAQWIPLRETSGDGAALRRLLLPAGSREIAFSWQAPPSPRRREALLASIRFYQVTGSALEGEDGFATCWRERVWTIPPAEQFQPAAAAATRLAFPAWFRTQFSTRAAVDLQLDQRGFEQAPIFCNGVLLPPATPRGRTLLSADLLLTESPNELLVLSPEGQLPQSLRLRLARPSRNDAAGK